MTSICPPGPSGRLRFTVLGAFSATVDGRPARLGGRRPRSLLAALLLGEGAVVPEERLVAAVWEDCLPEKPRQAIHTHVAELRKELEPGRQAGERPAVLLRGPAGYALAVTVAAVDARRFTALVLAAEDAAATGDPGRAVELADLALGLWHGPAYADLADSAFLVPEIGRLDELHLIARETLVSGRLALGQHLLPLIESRALTAEHPLRESAWALHALALYRSGRPAEALQALATARGLLREQLGTDPGPELARLTQRVLAHDPALLGR
ncbi:AfsR/SARP family transcriptional regulator [Kitasatospora cineracea]|uniref:AfsR/SARP family transcriptional regulator n=1 Tax=Kitasatospora cineracea TaxID=88074 RepID=UPI0034234453